MTKTSPTGRPHLWSEPCASCGEDSDVFEAKNGAGYYYCPKGCGKFSFSKAKTEQIKKEMVMEQANYDDSSEKTDTSTENTEGNGSESAGGGTGGKEAGSTETKPERTPTIFG